MVRLTIGITETNPDESGADFLYQSNHGFSTVTPVIPPATISSIWRKLSLVTEENKNSVLFVFVAQWQVHTN